METLLSLGIIAGMASCGIALVALWVIAIAKAVREVRHQLTKCASQWHGSQR